MSALGQKQTCAAETMSALPPKADMCGATSDVRFTPKSRHQRSDLMSFQSSIVSFERAPCRYSRFACPPVRHHVHHASGTLNSLAPQAHGMAFLSALTWRCIGEPRVPFCMGLMLTLISYPPPAETCRPRRASASPSRRLSPGERGTARHYPQACP